jgi:membrane protein DedA with SNARE-associated domain
MLQAAILRYGYVMLFFGAAIEGDASLLTAAFLAHRRYFSTPAVILTAGMATFLVNQVYFWAARSRGRDTLKRIAAARRSAWLVDALNKHRNLLVFVSRFLYGFRIAIPAACGASDMPARTFTLIDLVGAALWSVLVGLGGYQIGRMTQPILGDLRRHEWLIAGALLIAALALVAVLGRDWRGGRFLVKE